MSVYRTIGPLVNIKGIIMALLILGVCELRIVTEQIHIKGSASHEGLKYIDMHHISDFWLGVILSGHKIV